MDKTALYKLSYGLYVVGTKQDGDISFAGCVVDAFIQAASTPLTVILCSMKKNNTNCCLKKHKEFSISVLSKSVDPFVIANFGFQTSKDVDKWSLVDHSLMDGLPVLDNAAAYLTCKINDYKEFDSHTVFFADVIDAKKGEGDPLIYGDYLKGSLKGEVMNAFKEYKSSLNK